MEDKQTRPENREHERINAEDRAIMESQTELAKVQVEIMKIQAQVQQGWQGVAKEVADKFERYITQKTLGERRYTTTLTIGILLFLAIIVSVLFTLTLMDKVGGESLVFFLGTLAGSVIMLVAERIESRE